MFPKICGNSLVRKLLILSKTQRNFLYTLDKSSAKLQNHIEFVKDRLRRAELAAERGSGMDDEFINETEMYSDIE